MFNLKYNEIENILNQLATTRSLSAGDIADYET